MTEEKMTEEKKKPTRVRLKDGRTADYVEPGARPGEHIVILDECGCRKVFHEDQIKLIA